ncbi:YhcN/YlaJ family sporulation lipoprotein [Bacillus sp. 31A1R]|uniref:YhcN/YlaJ family sporulation lipoprotein n=1 Tax=Robertmurraya mangrovi TaxID=3098077 RepID=A0ABU5IYB7_9BACI|nr:YhcN/YlaJ family sporulation lipoprotein [Bacillus sp. 31A1R]MDZ5472131.1 YhcN/YlaJ family sporulation lipoprotein [Bacillus sp. 31A1R]
MKKSLLILGLCSATALTACQNDAGRGDFMNQTGHTLNVNDQRAEIYNRPDDVSEDFGYVRHQKSPIAGDNRSLDHYAAIDREKVADIIGKYCTEIRDVDDISTLVTDEEVLIIYNTTSKNRFETADQVKKMAMSVVPRWYHVYVSDNTNLRKQVESYATLDSDSRNVENGIDGIIDEMLKSPQGRKMSAGENANGETIKGGVNNNLDKDRHRVEMQSNGNQNRDNGQRRGNYNFDDYEQSREYMNKGFGNK